MRPRRLLCSSSPSRVPSAALRFAAAPSSTSAPRPSSKAARRPRSNHSGVPVQSSTRRRISSPPTLADSPRDLLTLAGPVPWPHVASLPAPPALRILARTHVRARLVTTRDLFHLVRALGLRSRMSRRKSWSGGGGFALSGTLCYGLIGSWRRARTNGSAGARGFRMRSRSASVRAARLTSMAWSGAGVRRRARCALAWWLTGGVTSCRGRFMRRSAAAGGIAW